MVQCWVIKMETHFDERGVSAGEVGGLVPGLKGR